MTRIVRNGYPLPRAVTIRAYRTGISAWYDCPLSTGKVEGINHKIKVMKRVAYVF
nr:MAG TPA: transposase [Caudoviricetes sp.]